MRGFISTSSPSPSRLSHGIGLAAAVIVCGVLAFGASGAMAADAGRSRTLQPEESDFTGTPYTEYGEFNEDAEEEADARFFAHGRFFGVSIGAGIESIDGNRGVLWSGGFPLIDFKVHYWFDFNFALDLGFSTVSHNYDAGAVNQLGQVDVNLFRLGVNLKYYFDTKNLSAPISFANPFVLVGVGSYTKSEFSIRQGVVSPETSIGFSAGFGLEFALRPRKSYFQIEAKGHIIRFRDTDSSDYDVDGNVAGDGTLVPRLSDLRGNFYTVTGNLMFTW